MGSFVRWQFWVCILLFSSAVPVQAQLQITEILYDSTSTPESNWEWFELYNGGSDDIDLDGYIFDDFSTAAARTEPNIVRNLGFDVVVNTVVPAKTAAVVYNAAGLEFDESRFRNAWDLSASVPLIGVNGWQALNQGGDAIGLWADLDSYTRDLANIDEDDDLEVASFANAVTSIDYREGFPGTGAGASMEWNDSGSFATGDNWYVNDESTASVSVATSLDDLPINNAADLGNPGFVVGDVDAASSLVITEIMYNPASDEPDWEWIEVFNGSNSTIDFELTPYVLDDAGGGTLATENLTVGQIPAGEVAILFRNGITVDDMADAWGGDLNYIAVSGWQALNNGGDLIAIWDSYESYSADSAGEVREDLEAITSVRYADGDADFPNVGQGNSISLLDASVDPDVGANWILSVEGDGDSEFANAVIDSQEDHAGGDMGTPGVFGTVNTPEFNLDQNDDGQIDAADATVLCASVEVAGISVEAGLSTGGRLAGDFDLNGRVEFADFLTLSANFNDQNVSYAEGDADCSGAVDFADFLQVSGNFGKVFGSVSAVPEPSSLFSVWYLTLGLGAWRGRYAGCHRKSYRR